ncbi:alpha/beta hydrolase [Streptosporangium sp. NBC_01495]|uniref:alpha/beta fold hydrolase n=1 Tax=Streptosporangium sp. NBC_01495 TaxID=2903899 RepID=UPI002E353508|nr:alpha/beta hydrolase [Streptosporangium sp. NBC_01495]
MTKITERFVDAGGIRMHLAEAGSGPLVLLLHGFPESWYSWRHQLAALAEAGYHAVAPDLRGYGHTDRPDRVEDYTMLHLVGDVIGLIDALGEQRAVVAGHDWGANVAWHTALLRPDRVRAVAGLSVPQLFSPRPVTAPLATMRTEIGDGFYVVYFQQPGVADEELGRDPRATLRRFFHSASGEEASWQLVVPPGGGFLDTVAEPDNLPGWLTEGDLDTFTAQFEHAGFTGGVNYYRNLDRNWALLAPWRSAAVLPPALFILGDRDVTFTWPEAKDLIAGGSTVVPNQRETVVLPGCGHWTQQERPAEVNQALIAFLRSL